jgi:DNA-binding response OmpR family regulator
MPRILIIEDELPMRTALEDTLRDEGHRVISAADGETGLQRAAEEKPDLVLLDIMMPKVDGFTVCRGLRRLGLRMPVLMLTARGQIDDKVEGLDAGADDYLVKPFNRRELLARVRALCRRTETGQPPPPDRIRFGKVEIDFLRHECRRDGKAVALTPKEFAMLRLLAAQPGGTVSRDEFLDRVWGYGSYPVTRTVDNHIARLRAKLEPDPASPQFLLTINKEGYRLNTAPHGS